jgi:hypothetical protein
MMVRRLIVVNLAFLVVIGAGVAKLRRDAAAFSSTHRISRIEPPAGKEAAVSGAAAPAIAAPENWTEIAARNPFSFDRNDIAIVASTPPAQQPKRPKPILFGTLMLGDDRLAMLSPGDSANRSSRPVRVNETFDGWVLVRIQDKSVVVRSGEVEETVIMNDPTALQIARGTEKTSAPASAPQAATIAPAPLPAPQQIQSQPHAGQPAPNSPTGKRQIVVRTPFGDKIMDDPSQ